MSEKKLTGTFYGTTREDEEKKLKRVIQVAEEKLNGIRQNAANLQEELKSLREVYDVEDKEGLAQWFNTDARFKEVRNDMRRAERAGKKPFFGRIDIEDDENGKRETFYIGKSVIAKNPSEPEVIDWRAPISSVYYDHSLGNCTYKVPKEGIFKVDLKRKRTYEIEEGNIKDYYDSDVVANDDLLTNICQKAKGMS
jgi:DNA helicase-2/ATP-dependent DNA helicase PcrA